MKLTILGSGTAVPTLNRNMSGYLFEINNKKYAIEVETGSAFKKIKDLKEKIKLLNKNYHKWFFVVTDRNLVKKYKNLADSHDLRFLKKKLQNLLRQNKKSQSG